MPSLSPEAKRIPEMYSHFSQSGLLAELLRDALLFHDPHERDIVSDAREIFSRVWLNYSGLENIPTQGGALLIFNHPEVPVIAPAIFSLPYKLDRNLGRHDVSFMMGSELPVWGNIYFPGSPWLINRLAGVYPGHFLLVPTSRLRPEYRRSRDQIRHQVVLNVLNGHLVALAPEGQVEEAGAILPVDLFRHRAGDLGQAVTLVNAPIIPMGVWQDENGIVQINVGPQFNIQTHGHAGAVEMMAKIAAQLPDQLRGPFA